METAVVCIPISGGQIERLKALYPVLKEEILKRYPDFDETISVDWIEAFEFILNREQNEGAVRILINTLLTYEEAAAKAWKIRSCRDMLVHYLEELQLDLDRKEALEQGETP